MKRQIIIKFLTVTLSIYTVHSALAQDYRKSVVTDPSISRRCESLLAKRNKKIKHKQKISALISRNRKLQKVVPVQKKTLKEKLTINHSRLTRELHLTLTKVTHLEENIVRRGCPGITL